MTKQRRKSFEELRRETEELLARYASRLEKDENGDNPVAKPSGEEDAITPAPDDAPISFEALDYNEHGAEPAPDRETCAFETSLSALRATLRAPSQDIADDRQKAALVNVSVETETVEDQSEVSHAMDIPEALIEEPPPVVDTPSVSALDNVPMPIAEPPKTPPPISDKGASKKSKRSKSRTSTTSVLPLPPNDSASIASALKDVRQTVGDVEFADRVVEPEPLERQETPPIPDEIPKSVSEELPKYPAKARTRTCNRCGNETKLRDEKCRVCGRVDASLGILDNVIAGDLLRVNQILLVKPHAISLRTSTHDWTLLHMAAAGGNPKMVELLIGKGASVNAQCHKGKTPLHYAASKGYPEIVKGLLQHYADTSLLYRGKTPIDLARSHGHDEIVGLLEDTAS